MTDFLTISSPQLAVEISPYGAALARAWLDRHPQSLVLGLPQAEDYAAAPHAIGVIVGPVAGRIDGAKTQISGKTYHLETDTPPHCLHSGPHGIQNRLWEVTHHAADTVTLEIALPDGACGLPGNRTIRATYSIENTELLVRIETDTDADTIANATSHAYWTLDGSGDLLAHDLTLSAQHMLTTGADLIPTGEKPLIANGPFDFSAPRCPVAGPPIDTCFCLPEVAENHEQHVLTLHSTRSGLTLDVTSNQPGVVLYTGENMPLLEAPDNTPPIAPFCAIAIEAQGWPNAANRPQFPSIFLKSGQRKTQLTRFAFSKS